MRPRAVDGQRPLLASSYMHFENEHMKKFLLASVVVGTVSTFVACHAKDDSLNWTEDVRLPDGRVVTLNRHQEFKGPYELGDSPSPSDNWFEFKHPDTGQLVRWQSDLKIGERVPFGDKLPALPHDYHLGLATVELMMDGKTPVLLVKTEWSGSLDLYNCPSPRYLLYRWETDSSWNLVPLEQLPLKRFRSNMSLVDSGYRKNIEASNLHLNAEQTSSSESGWGLPYILNFGLMHGPQTFGRKNCGGEPDYVVEPYKRTSP